LARGGFFHHSAGRNREDTHPSILKLLRLCKELGLKVVRSVSCEYHNLIAARILLGLCLKDASRKSHA
jgi:hypothetical protein